MKTYLVLLAIAKRDLEATGYLLEKDLFPHSVFYLGQCVEKAFKSLALWSLVIGEAEAKKSVRHEAYEINTKLFERVDRYFLRTGERSFLLRGWKLPFDLLKKVLSDEHIAVTQPFSAELLQDFLTKIQEGHRRLMEIEEEAARGDEESADKRYLAEFAYCFDTLTYLSVVFSAHSTISRYPEGEFDPLQFYKEGLPVVDELHSFKQIAEGVCQLLENMYVEWPPPRLDGTS